MCEREEDLKGGKDIYYGFSHSFATWTTVLLGVGTLALSFYPQEMDTALLVFSDLSQQRFTRLSRSIRSDADVGVVNGPLYQRVFPFLFLVTLLPSAPRRSRISDNVALFR